jgi:PleD family two-component response regulator
MDDQSDSPVGVWDAPQSLIGKISRALILHSTPQGGASIANMLRPLDFEEIVEISDPGQVLLACSSLQPQLLIVQHIPPLIDGVQVAYDLRRCDLSCRRAAVIMAHENPTLTIVSQAMDAGVHEFLKSPFHAGDLYLRLEAVFTKPRPWVETDDYVGPSLRPQKLASRA